MFSVNNLRLGTITATDYCLGSVPVQKMYLGQMLIFDRTEAITTQYVFRTETGITTFSANAVNGSFGIPIRSYKINSDGSGREELNIMIADDGGMDWCTPSITNSGSTYTLHLVVQDNATTSSRTCRITIRQNESNQALAISLTQAAGTSETVYTFGHNMPATHSVNSSVTTVDIGVGSYKQQKVNGQLVGELIPVGYDYSIQQDTQFVSLTRDEESDHNGYTYWHINITENTTTFARTAVITFTQNETDDTCTFTINQAAGLVNIQYTFNFDGLDAEEDKTESITRDAQDISSVLGSYKETYINGVAQNDRTYVPVSAQITSGSTYATVDDPNVVGLMVNFDVSIQENITTSSRIIRVIYTQEETNEELRQTITQSAGQIDTKYTFTVPQPTISIPSEANGGNFTLTWESYKQDVVNGEVQDAKTKVGVVTNSLEVPDWIQLSSQEEGELGNSLTFNFSNNTTASERSFTFELTQQETSDKRTVVVTQAAANIETTYTWNVTPTTVTIDGTDTATINVTSYKQQWIGDIQQGSLTPVDFQYTNPGLEESIQANKVDNGNGSWTITLSGGSPSIDTTYQMVFTANEGDNTTSVTVNKVVAGRNYGDITITEFTYHDIAPASGGTLTPTLSYTQSWGYGDSTTDGGTITSGATLQFAGGAVNASNGQYTYATKGTELSEQTDTQVTVIVSLNGKTKTATANASQAANTRTAVITDSEFTTAYRDFPASGMANVSWSGYGNITHEPKAEWKYTSGSKANIEATYQWIDGTDHNIPSRGTTVGERQKVLQRDGEWYLVDQCTFVEGDLEVLYHIPELWQQANEITDTQYTEWTITQSNIDDVSAEGDTITVNPSIKRTKTDTYTSTATKQTEETSIEFTLQSNQSWAVVNGKNINVSQNTGGERSATITITSNGKSTTFTVTQSTGQTITSYGDITINGGSAVDIPASGGTVKASGCTANIQVTYSSGSTETVTVPAQNITYTEVSAESLGTTIKARTKVGTSTCNVSYQGKSASKQIDVYQAANNATYGKPVVSCTYNDIPASGGSVNPTSSFTQRVRYTSDSISTVSTGGTWSYANANNSYTGQVTASSKGKIESDRTTERIVTAIITINGQVGSKQVTVYQQANIKTEGEIEYGDLTPVFDLEKTTAAATGDEIEYTARFTRTQSRTDTWTSGESEVVDLGIDVEYGTADYVTPGTHNRVDWVTRDLADVGSGYEYKAVIAANTTPSPRSFQIELYYDGYGYIQSETITQSSGEKLYATPVISEVSMNDVPASGMTAGSYNSDEPEFQQLINSFKVTQTWGYGQTTGGGTETYTWPEDGSNLGTTLIKLSTNVPSKGTTTSSRTNANQQLRLQVGSNLVDGHTMLDLYQEANTRTYGDISISGGSVNEDIPASGGSKSASGCTATIRVDYNSGAYENVSVPSSNISYSSVSGSNLGTTSKARTKVGTSKCTVSYQGKTATKDFDVYQQANSSTSTDIDYGTWQINVSANPTSIAVGGGTSTITRSASRTRKQNYTWTSGATSQSDLSNETATPTLSVSGTGFSLNGTTVTAASNIPARTYTLTASNPKGDLEEGPDQELTSNVTSTYTQPSSNSRSCTVTATHGGVSKQATISQGGQSQSSGNQDWTVAKGTNMQTATKSGSTITMVPNAEYGNKNETYTATCTATQTTSNKTATITGTWYKGYLNVDPAELDFTADGGTKQITIDTNLNWQVMP